jgi:SAM-dependent methyltransferase
MSRKRQPTTEATRPVSKGVDYYLTRLLREVPLHRALVRAAECDLLAALEMPRPLLDVGAGDGTFAWALFDEPLDVGADPDGGALQEARRLAVYRNLAQAAGAPLPFRDGAFASILSNSTLEHIPDLAPVLAEFSRVLAEDGVCVITVPSDQFLSTPPAEAAGRALRALVQPHLPPSPLRLPLGLEREAGTGGSQPARMAVLLFEGQHRRHGHRALRFGTLPADKALAGAMGPLAEQGAPAAARPLVGPPRPAGGA